MLQLLEGERDELSRGEIEEKDTVVTKEKGEAAWTEEKEPVKKDLKERKAERVVVREKAEKEKLSEKVNKKDEEEMEESEPTKQTRYTPN